MSIYKNDKLDYLKLSVQSVLNQTFKDFDFFIQLDGDISDDCFNYLNSIGDHRIIINKRKVNKGLAVSLNDLLHKALPLGYIYIARMDADDICEPERLEKQVSFLDSNNDYDLVGSNAILIDENSKIIGEKKVKNNFTFSDLIKKNELIHSSILFRIDFFKKVGFYDHTMVQGQDYDLWLRTVNKKIKMCNLNDNLIQFRYDIDLVSRRKNGQKFEIKIKKKYLKGIKLWIAILPNILIILLPKFILKLLLKFRVGRYGKNLIL